MRGVTRWTTQLYRWPDVSTITGAVVDATATVPRNFPGSYDHDGDPNTPAFTGTFTCADPLTCRVDLENTDDQGAYQAGTTVSAIANYRFTGTRTMASVDAMEDNTYLAFGIWLRETVVDTETSNVNTYQFGAFAGGGGLWDTSDDITTVPGSATYKGDATGIHATADRMDFFSAKATLNAAFGDGTELGAITGQIHDNRFWWRRDG